MAMSVSEKYRNLWKNTFGDSDKYLDIIESTYFKPGRILVEKKGSEIIAGMLTIPYQFAGGELSGLYLCGLCTSVEYRGQGIMSKLIAKAAQKAENEGFDFLFLIPDGEKLRRYYAQRGFVDGAFRQVVCYPAAHEFVTDTNNTKIKFFEYDPTLRNRLCEFVNCFENNYIASVIHSAKDVDAVIEENGVSGGRIVYAEDEFSNICGVSFVEVYEAELKIMHTYCNCKSVENDMLGFVKNSFPEKSITIYKYPEHNALLLMNDSDYCCENPGAGMTGLAEEMKSDVDSNGDVEPYAMFRLLNHGKILELMAAKALLSDIKVLNAGEESYTHYVSKNGRTEIKECKIPTLSRPSDIMDDTSLAKMIWRMPSNGKLVEDVRGISRLPSDVCLMLD